jgi:hypothetical protein
MHHWVPPNSFLARRTRITEVVLGCGIHPRVSLLRLGDTFGERGPDQLGVPDASDLDGAWSTSVVMPSGLFATNESRLDSIIETSRLERLPRLGHITGPSPHHGPWLSLPFCCVRCFG